jgi:extradiol dioxygenase family protein
MSLAPFHLAIAVHDLAEAREFYGNLLACPEGRSTAEWIDFDFYGHQLVCHQVPGMKRRGLPVNRVDGEAVPIPHFGVVLAWSDWELLAARLKSARVEFIIDPTIRFAGQTGEQATLFFADPSGNMLEFKALRDPAQLFAK